jgi:2,3-bisphosphoglycerate-independent phosphoglycerate mutase
MLRPLAFGVRLRDKQRTVRVRHHDRKPDRYVVEDSRAGRKTRAREHTSLAGALQDLAATWRKRLH